jgi:predicted ATPase/signal transduction histidine kinase
MIEIQGYQADAVIYESANSRILRGRRDSDGAPVIIKLPGTVPSQIKAVARLRHEYEILKHLDVDGTIRCYGMVSYMSTDALILEDIGANALASMLASGPLPLNEFLDIAIQTATVLGAVHEAGIIHKDLNPSNIVISKSTRRVQLIDFGIASRLPRETQEVKNPNLLEGTLPYLAPEQTGRMNRSVDYRADFYGLGMTFYEMLTCQTAFLSMSVDPMELVHCHIAKSPASPRELNAKVPEVVAEIILKLLAKTAEDRYQSAYGLLVDLQRCRELLTPEGSVSSFPIGRHDVPRRLQPPQKLYGREAEALLLLAAFERVSKGQAELILISGYSGIGKSSLVHEVHKPIVAKRGYFVSGKFEQYRRDIPYDSIIQAFKMLIKMLALETEEQRAVWRGALERALSPSGAVLTAVIPELELIIGKQPPAPPIGPADAHARFNRVFKAFLGVFSALEHPLVVFLDDLQWADAASIKLISDLLTDDESPHIMLIGAYRDNEVDPVHPVAIAMDKIQKAQRVPMHRMKLKPLSSVEIREMVADTVHRSVEAVAPIAELLEQKTNGNPFFLGQLLTELYESKQLWFNPAEGVWQWTLEEVRAARITDNVVELLISKIGKLGPRTQEVLKLAAFMRNQFELSLLSVIDERPPVETASALWEALQEGLIIPLNERYQAPELYLGSAAASPGEESGISYRFLHDRVQQAAYALIEEEQKRAVHLKIGRLLLRKARTDAAVFEAQLFDILGHLILGIELVTDPAERIEIAQLALEAGQKAKSALAYAAGLRFLRVGMSLLPKDSWGDFYDLSFTLYRERAQCEYLTGDFEQSEAMFDVLLENTKTKLQKAEIYSQRITMYTLALKYRESLRSGLDCLRLFGIDLELQPSDATVESLLEELKQHLGSRSIRELISSPPVKDPEKQLAQQVLMTMLPTTVHLLVNLYHAFCGHLGILNVRYGHTPFSAAAYAAVGSAFAARGEPEIGCEFGRLATQLALQAVLPAVRGRSLMMVASTLTFRDRHLRAAVEELQAAFQAAIQGNDPLIATFCGSVIVRVSFAMGKNLEEVREDLDTWLDRTRKARAQAIVDNLLVTQRAVLSLIGKSGPEPDADGGKAADGEAEFERRLGENNTPLVACFHFHYKSMARYLFDDYEGARTALEEVEKRRYSACHYLEAQEHIFYQGLILAQIASAAAPEERAAHLNDVRKNLHALGLLAAQGPMNFAHKHILVEAELARVEGRNEDALDLYDRAIALATEHGYVHHAAIANELAGNLYLCLKKLTPARAYLREARSCYAWWGARAKVQHLTEKHSQLMAASGASYDDALRDWLSTSTSSTLEDGWRLDLVSVVKAAQAISSEIQLERLLGKLIKILIENAGADRGCLLLPAGNQLVIEAFGTIGSTEVEVLQSIPVKGCDRLSSSIVDYVVRTEKPVVLHNATLDPLFSTDPYIAEKKVKSLLCVPAINLGKLIGVIYLENSLSEGSFTTDRIELLRILSAQIAISIENASLYANLEEKVRQRTEQLRQAQARLVMLERQTAERQMAGGFAHEMRNALTGAKMLIYKIYRQTAGSEVCSAFVQNYERMKAILTEIRERLPEDDVIRIAGHLQGINMAEKDVDHVLGAINQSLQRGLGITGLIFDYAEIGKERPGMDAVSVPMLVASVLQEFEDSFASHRIDVDVKVPEGCTLTGNELHFRSILSNLVSNARDALCETKSGARTLSIEAVEQSERVVLSVRDTGGGIRPEEHENIFQPFFSTKPASGTGLGLNTVQKIAAIYNGVVEFESVLHQGSTFRVLLPKALPISPELVYYGQGDAKA